ncbi:dUTP diphosphatase, partial [Priestia megaterium]|uniref:dUTP diphosphatase n=1 Tax=Priestia megaterium TaxID=1404 RepID=UPI0035B604ED
AWALPDGFMGLIRPRSGHAVKHGLHVMAGLLDSDYRGELKVLLVNLGEKPVTFSAGDRIAQMVVTMCYQRHLTEVEDLGWTARADGGFGSTGQA